MGGVSTQEVRACVARNRLGPLLAAHFLSWRHTLGRATMWLRQLTRRTQSPPSALSPNPHTAPLGKVSPAAWGMQQGLQACVPLTRRALPCHA